MATYCANVWNRPKQKLKEKKSNLLKKLRGTIKNVTNFKIFKKKSENCEILYEKKKNQNVVKVLKRFFFECLIRAKNGQRQN